MNYPELWKYEEMNFVSKTSTKGGYTKPIVTTDMPWTVLDGRHENINKKNRITMKLILVPCKMSVTFHYSVFNTTALRKTAY